MRLIDADELMDRLYDNEFQTLCPLDEVSTVIDGCATIEAEPVVHGRWVDKMVRDWHCSECGEKLAGHGWDGYCYDDLPNYCPNCGARMDGE